MKIASFNVNSIRIRMEALCDYLAQEQPDILGLQETKVVDLDFPFEPLADLGYEIEVFGQKSYNGVALLSKVKPKTVTKGFPQDRPEDQKRLITARFGLKQGGDLVVVNGYFPQGESRSHETKFPAKAKFYKDLWELLRGLSPQDLVVVMGDFNVAPTDLDVGIGPENAKRWLRTGKCCFLPEEREWLKQLTDWGLYDSFRALHPQANDQFSWFDYRSGGFPDRGLRIDLLLVTQPLLQRCKTSEIDYRLRALDRPSDHCIVSGTFDLDL
ncbi:MAG: exodeoxyribonuclease III [Candidatus Lambdaproteobacteria bacterium RIFOXYD1_FULL_56_27]|uniref:Exodeoxyribonuclease III n=1 Tax=Candidatus Lambdaproteobacteria bacterium RIFOXYD2_FULL_56_26 TaxID=1817773 RepID=A0A1F6GR47_9PROT|nr:MAG: exodeoxyribonuclease III [Candidatus Lambdaproteobacteria bacterium RIFOXYC1_FULL_56_13]OGH00635.1 MAG: exodeoxyribonuclease III [Candidatus Lambdaproteobacteria bacterium RIFOXYD2_FULL_56_26]OGH07801.1 MAG: exodeoxyribonuclease III [Candidatus Lambdaproteobacteria bacterium RIFOXYD1_FULL_56_27]